MFSKLTLAILLMSIMAPATSKAGVFGYDNYWECILDKMDGVKNNAVAREVIRECKSKKLTTYVKEKGSLFGTTASECVQDNADDVASELGAARVKSACYRLYPRK